MLKVQQIVKSFPEVVWERGFSICYRDQSYTKTKKKICFKFDRIEVKGDLGVFKTKLEQALKDEGHVIDLCRVYKDEILIWQEFSIQIIENA